MVHIPDNAIKIFPPVDSFFLFVDFRFCDTKFCSNSLGTDVILRLDLTYFDIVYSKA